MDTGQRFCQNCGSPIGTGLSFCTKCGSAVAQAPPASAAPPPAPQQTPQQYQQPAPQQTPQQYQQPAPQQAPQQYQQPAPQQAPQQYQQPAPQQAPQQYQQPYAGVPYGTAPPKKKSGAGKVILIVAIILVLVGGGAAILLTRNNRSSVQEEYPALLNLICDSKTPEGVATKKMRLDEFQAANIGKCDDDLTYLMDACVKYNNADTEGTERYFTLIEELEPLTDSSVSQVARCAKRLTDYVSDVFGSQMMGTDPDDAFDPVTPVDPGGDDSESLDFPLQIPSGIATLTTYQGQNAYTFPLVNNTNKQIVWCEFMVFFYDASGNPDIGADGTNWAWIYHPIPLDPSVSYANGEFAYFALTNNPSAVYVVPVCSYVEFSDGTYWGYTDAEFMVTQDVMIWVTIMNGVADAILEAVVG